MKLSDNSIELIETTRQLMALDSDDDVIEFLFDMYMANMEKSFFEWLGDDIPDWLKDCKR